MKFLITCFLFLFAMVFGEMLWAQGPQIGAMAPTPVLVKFDGQYQFLSKLYYQGEDRLREPRTVVVLSFMGLKCPPCRKELPLLLEVMRPLVSRGQEKNIPIRFFLVSTDLLSAKETLRAFFEEQGVDLASEVLLDPYGKAAMQFGKVKEKEDFKIPRTFVVSAQGRITADITGASDHFKVLLREGIRAALKEGAGQSAGGETRWDHVPGEK